MNAKLFAGLPSFLFSFPAFIMLFFANSNQLFAAGGEMTNYFQPMPIYDKLESTGIWGASGVVPREIHNGLEDSSCKKWSYWDGAILKGKDGKYHLYCSRWDQSLGHNGWNQSIAVHAVSDKATGPYVDKGPIYTWSGGKGHNVTAIALPDGRYAVLVDEIVPATIFIANDPNGPFEYQGPIIIDQNGHNTGSSNLQSNLSICMREDSTFLIVTKDGYVMHSTKGIMGPYLVKTDKIYPQNLPGYNTTLLEDPNIWRIGKKYFCIVNSWMSKTAMYLTSDDGINNWKFAAKGWSYNANDPTFLRYPDGTKNKWPIMERPAVFVENGHVTHLTFGVIDVEKSSDQGNDNHDSKIIVVPFNGKAFDGDTSTTVKVAGIGNSATQGVGGSALVPVFTGYNVSVVERMIASGGRYDLRIFDVRGVIVYRTILDGSQETLGKTRGVLQSAPAMRWVSVRKLK